MYTTPSLIQKTSGSAENKNFEVVLMDLNDIAQFPTRDANGVVMVGDFVMKPGKYATKLQVSSSKTSLPVTSEGEEDNVSISALPEFSVPGSSLDFEELVANWTNRSVVAAVQVGACAGSGSFYRVYGSQCAPLSLLLEGQNNNDGTMNLVKFQQFAKSNLMPGRYTGNFTLATANVVAADATEVDATAGNGEYQLTDNAAATVISDITNATNNGKYTLLGSGGANPATIEANNANFVLVGGVDWQGLSGSRITFNAIDAGGGDHTFIEISRS